MGASFFNFAVPTTDTAAVEMLLNAWLEHKGFVRRDVTPRFECHREHERGVFLITGSRWTVILYSHAIEEGRRLQFELGKLRLPSAQLWVYDSDHWGWRIFRDRKVVDAFYSHPTAEIGDEEANQPADGDPSVFADAFGLDDKVNDLASIQRARALFKERLLERFCAAIGASGASLSYRDLEEQYLGFDANRDLAGIKLRRLCFAREGYDGTTSSLRLHELKVEPRPQAKFAGPVIEPSPAVHLVGGAIRAISLVVTWLFLAIGFIRRPFSGSNMPRTMSGVQADAMAGRFLDPAVGEIFRDLPPSMSRDGALLINNRHRCAITLPPDAQAGDLRGMDTFFFTLDGVDVACRAFAPDRAEHLRWLFQTAEGDDLSDDRSFNAGEMPGRAIYSRTSRAGGTWFGFFAIVQAPNAIYQFSAQRQQEIPPPARHRITEIVSSLSIR